MVKADSPPTKKGGKKLEGIKEEEELSDEDKTNLENIKKFLSTILHTSWSQFLGVIVVVISSRHLPLPRGTLGPFKSSLEMLKQCHRVNKDMYFDTYAAFLASQTQTSKKEYERFKSDYAAKNCFEQVKILLQTFQSSFQVTLTPRLCKQTIFDVVHWKGDRGDSPIARQNKRKT
jgi:hypothetical protein